MTRRQDDVVQLTLGTGENRNALRMADWTRLRDLCLELSHDADVRLVILRGSSGTFCAGSDIEEWLDMASEDIRSTFIAMEAAFQAVESLPMPSLAVVEGVAAGGGCQLALACDLRMFASTARIGMPTGALGIFLPPAFVDRLRVIAGKAATFEVLYTGRLLTAREAWNHGLIQGLVDAESVDADIAQLVTSILQQPAGAVRAVKAVMLLTHPCRMDPAAMPFNLDLDLFRPRVADFVARRRGMRGERG